MKLLRGRTKGVNEVKSSLILALTLVEMMITMGIFSMVMMALLYVHMFGLRQDELVESKLGASDAARRGFDQLMRDIRGAQTFDIGNCSGGAFTIIAQGSNQVGNAVRLGLVAPVYPSTNITYYFDTNTPGNFTLNRMHTGETTQKVVVSQLTNFLNGPLNFQSEKFDGTLATDNQDRRVIHCTIAFAQYQYPLTRVGSNYLYDYYKMEFRVTPHVPYGH